jgi:hypothetical protein
VQNYLAPFRKVFAVSFFASMKTPNTKTGEVEQSTTRYEVHDNGILKVQGGSRYTFIEGAELDNLVMATRMYYEQVARGVYKRDPRTGKMLA